MISATTTIPPDLEAELDEVARKRNLSRAEVIQFALRKYLDDLQVKPSATAEDDYRPFWVSVIPEKHDRGEPDVSINHDYYFAEDHIHRKRGRCNLWR